MASIGYLKRRQKKKGLSPRLTKRLKDLEKQTENKTKKKKKKTISKKDNSIRARLGSAATEILTTLKKRTHKKKKHDKLDDLFMGTRKRNKKIPKFLEV